MAEKKYITLSNEALSKLCGLIRESHSVADAIDDTNSATNSTYSSAKINELLAELDNSDDESYVAGAGIVISEDKIISTKDIKKNYIDNSNFRINQTGATEYSTPNGYTVDRWYIDGGILTPVENGVQFTNPNTETGAASLVRLRQNIHYGFAEFAGKTITLSAKINGVVYSSTATIPTEKPTTGTAVQYITAGIADFSINLNYSVTADYFVPYFALAYNRTAMFEWMKLEVNDEFSGYIEPDYMTELIKMNFTTSDKGALDIPTGGESYDDTEIKADIEQIETDILLLKETKINDVTLTGELDSQTDLKIAGKVVAGQIFTINGQNVTAQNGAEVFNGMSAKATGVGSHAEGTGTTASGGFSHAEGASTTASGDYSHAEGAGTTASGNYSHAEGAGTTAKGLQSHAEGASTTASGDFSHAEGAGTTASGNYSHAEGMATKASSECQHVQGKNNVEDADNKYAFIIGNGEDGNNRSNALAIDWDGKIYVNNSETGIDLNDLLNRIIAFENK